MFVIFLVDVWFLWWYVACGITRSDCGAFATIFAHLVTGALGRGQYFHTPYIGNFKHCQSGSLSWECWSDFVIENFHHFGWRGRGPVVKWHHGLITGYPVALEGHKAQSQWSVLAESSLSSVSVHWSEVGHMQYDSDGVSEFDICSCSLSCQLRRCATVQQELTAIDIVFRLCTVILTMFRIPAHLRRNVIFLYFACGCTVSYLVFIGSWKTFRVLFHGQVLFLWCMRRWEWLGYRRPFVQVFSLPAH